MAKVAVSVSFLDAEAKLKSDSEYADELGPLAAFSNRLRSRLAEYAGKSEAVPGGDMRLVRISSRLSAVAVFSLEGSGTALLLWAGAPEQAAAWAAEHCCGINPRIGEMQVYAKTEEAVKPEPDVYFLPEEVTDEVLLRLGVPQAQISYVRSLADEKALYGARRDLPESVFERLVLLAVGSASVEEVLALTEAEQEAEQADGDVFGGSAVPDFAEALQKPGCSRSFAIVEGEDELFSIINGPLAKWRVFLHPQQQALVHKVFSGPARVTGAAGTGKTVAAMHRAKWLASRLKPGEKLLFTTFTKNLAADIENNLRSICTSEEMEHIEVANLDAWVSRFLKSHGLPAIRYNTDDEWEKAAIMAGSEYSAGFCSEEWIKVAAAQDAFTKEAYLRARREGRGKRLDRRGRLKVWEVFAEYLDLMNFWLDPELAMYKCRLLLEQEQKAENASGGTQAYPYAAVVVDEGQDFSPGAYRLLRMLAGEHADDIFIVGDSHQRIYRNKAVLSRCNIMIRGRSSSLRVNYRTTEETRRFAFAMLDGLSFDDMDEGIDDGKGCISLTHGDRPEVRCFGSREEELSFIAGQIQELICQGVPPRTICVTVRSRELAKIYADGLEEAGISVLQVKRSQADRGSEKCVRIATMHRVKGLEFAYVFAAAVNSGVVPLESTTDWDDEVSKAENLKAERCLLYVALTRAQKKAFITGFGRLSPFVQSV